MAPDSHFAPPQRLEHEQRKASTIFGPAAPAQCGGLQHSHWVARQFMKSSIYICILYTCTSIHVHPHTHVYTHIHTHEILFACLHFQRNVVIFDGRAIGLRGLVGVGCTWLVPSIGIYTYTYTYTFAYTNTYTHTHTHTRMHACIHT